MHAYGAACVLLILVLCQEIHSLKYRVCVVDGRGIFQKSTKYCPILNQSNSPVECVIGTDRLDCLRKIWKRKADFSVFTPEDLVTAINTGNDLLITNELRYNKEDNFEYEVVAVIRDSSGIKSIHDLADKRFCHPGFGDDTDWTRVLANYLEASVVPQTCNSFLTLTENRISASSNFFQQACKAGPWVRDSNLDETLKKQYPNLCELCDRGKCDRNDKYWGRRGVLYCLTDGIGDISWARLDDVRSHFGVIPGAAVLSPDGYKFLCRDGSVKPINSTNPCVWVVRPWPVVATNRTSAVAIQLIVSNLNHNDTKSWQSALLNILETYHADIKTLDNTDAVSSYLEKATGFLSANSFTGCHPPRTIRVCTTSNAENAKCGWMREVAAVHGIEPDIDCLKADNTTHCMQAINVNAADIVMVNPDLIQVAKTEYQLRTLFYETVSEEDKYITSIVVKSDSTFNTLHDLKGAKACFPSYNGIAWNSLLFTLKRHGLITSCPLNKTMADFFGNSCAPGVPKEFAGNLEKLCQHSRFEGEYGAINCLLEGDGDVAFLSKNSLRNYLNDSTRNNKHLKMSNFKIICAGPSEGCHLSWSPIGQAMVSMKNSDLWFNETRDVFFQLDTLFGQNYDTTTLPFTMYGLYDGKSDLLFYDRTVRLRSVPVSKNIDKMPKQYEALLSTNPTCHTSSSCTILPSVVGLLIAFSSLLLTK